ncbi:unnamed protein product [Trifolium pratense]|uniref:Uncharacterized protein n=1 Tax=Trifolium pratense TaxID=57577 RepID=A0ACB0KCB3_TRIPR|nr:unnamed protein product [Trifolium pratense]
MTALYLPIELIIQILLRLPVKSLICFKSVCKTWFTLISNPNFGNSHFQFSESTQTLRILSISAIPTQIRSIDFEVLFNNHSNSLNPNLSLPQSYFPLHIKGSCRGFIFFNCSSNNYIWNPSTGFCKSLPLSPTIGSNFGTYSYLYGFGYDHSRDDYLLASLYPALAADVSSHLEIFSLRDNAWKEIEDTPFPYWSPYHYPKLGLLFNEALHWFVSRSSSLVDVIVSFNLMERKLFEIPIPSDFGDYLLDIGSWVFGEFLSLWAMRNRIVEIWVMKEYKVHSSWIKNIVLSIDTLPTKCFFPIYSTKSVDVIGTDDGSGLVKYNNKGHLLEYRTYCDDPRGSQVVMYTESLLSLPGDHEQV